MCLVKKSLTIRTYICRMRDSNEAPIAQLDRALGYELRGREFESLWAHHILKESDFGQAFFWPKFGLNSLVYNADKLASIPSLCHDCAVLSLIDWCVYV